MRLWSNVFFALAAVVAVVMCVVVVYNYVSLLRLGPLGGSAPAEVAFFLITPYALGIAACLTVAIILRKRSRKP